MVRSGLLCSAREIEGEQLRFSTLSLARPTPAALVASYMSSPFLEATLQKVGEQKIVSFIASHHLDWYTK